MISLSKFLWHTVCLILRLILSLRYKITFYGLEHLSQNPSLKNKNVVFLPNHSAMVDPVILFAWLWPKYKMRTLTLEAITRIPLAGSFLSFIDTITIPDFKTSINSYKIKKAERAIEKILQGIKNKNNFLIYPSGKIKTQGNEIVGGSVISHKILQEFPDLNIVLVRISGLWGSCTSNATENQLKHSRIKKIQIILQNGVFFMPRRKIHIDFEVNPSDLPRQGTRMEINRYLENWYNQFKDNEGNIHKIEPLKNVSYKFWKEEFIVIPNENKSPPPSLTISSETRTKVYKELQRILDCPHIEITPELRLGPDLGMDSLNLSQLIAFLSHNYEIKYIQRENLITVQDVLELAERKCVPEKLALKQYTSPVYKLHKKEVSRPHPTLHSGTIFPEVFLNLCHHMKPFIAISDDRTGEWTYKKLKRSVLILTEYFKTLPDSHIGVLLPSSIAVFAVILAIQCAGKIPVMLNWTLGPRYLDSMVQITGIKRVISSWHFLEQSSQLDLSCLIDQLEFIEHIKESIPITAKLNGFLTSCLPTPMILHKLGINKVEENEPAIILFTSGSEATPKGVPLSHKSLLFNIKNTGLSCYQCMSREDVWCGTLPPFHSFGLIGSFAPMFKGYRLVCYPNPTESLGLADAIERGNITTVALTPTFLKNLFQVAKKEQLKTLKMVVIGGERISQEICDDCNARNINFFEAYGVTECGPLISIRNSGMPHKGVGQLAQDMEIMIIHPDTLEPVTNGQEGEICVRGPNVFKGYLGSVNCPFIQIEGKSWYRTGDIGKVEEDRTIFLSGRLKRFIKVAGEMISLGAIEEILTNGSEELGQNPNASTSLAICVDEILPENPKLVLFTTFPIEKEMANRILTKSGLSALVKISFVHYINSIPILGSGKINYYELNQIHARLKNGELQRSL